MTEALGTAIQSMEEAQASVTGVNEHRRERASAQTAAKRSRCTATSSMSLTAEQTLAVGTELDGTVAGTETIPSSELAATKATTGKTRG